MTRAVDLFVGKINAGQTVEPVQVNTPRQSDEFIKAQEAKPAKKSRAKKPSSAASKSKSSASGKGVVRSVAARSAVKEVKKSV